MASIQPTVPGSGPAYGGRAARSWNWRRALSETGSTGDAIFRLILFFSVLLVVVILLTMILNMAANSALSIRTLGFRFITDRVWNPVGGQFGALPFIYGTIVSSSLGLLIAVPTSIGVAIFLVEQAR